MRTILISRLAISTFSDRSPAAVAHRDAAGGRPSDHTAARSGITRTMVRGLPFVLLAAALNLYGQQAQPAPPAQPPSQPSTSTSSQSAAPNDNATFADVTRCKPGQADTSGSLVATDCTPGLSLNADEPSTISIDGLPASPTPVTVVVETGGLFQAGGIEKSRLVFNNVPAPAGFVRIDVYLPRHIAPRYPTSGGNFWNSYRYVADPTALKSDGNPYQSPWIVMTYARPIDITVLTQKTAYHFEVQTRFERWHFDTGGFYALSWAREQSLITTSAPDVNGVPQTRVVTRRSGDQIGPTTGVTFVFHPSNYPDIGWEFGSATETSRPTSWYLGSAFRLRNFGDNTLLTISAGISRISVTEYPRVNEGTYAADDPLLKGRQHYVAAPYIALGLGVHFGGSESTQK
jgi:hypothetical protein